LNEQELIEQLAQKNESAFRWLVEHYRNRVYHTALNIVQDPKEAEDIAQETFIKVFESIKKFKQESSLSTWIYRITVHGALDKIRRKKTRQRLQNIVPWWMPAENKSSGSAFYHPGIEAENKEKAAILFRAIETLPEKQRIAFTLVKVQGISYEEAGYMLNQHIKALESLITRAKLNLQKKLESYYKK
jgi:RNA polymerase sigma factor (sigma-70 family)